MIEIKHNIFFHNQFLNFHINWFIFKVCFKKKTITRLLLKQRILININKQISNTNSNCMQDKTGIKIGKNWKCAMLGLLFQQTTTTFWPAILVQKNGWLCLGCSTPVSGQPEFSYLSHSSRQKKNPFTWEIKNKTIAVFLVPIH